MKTVHLLWMVIFIALAGCQAQRQRQAECTECLRKNQELEKQLNSQQQNLAQLQEQIKTLQNLPPGRLEQLVTVDHIELGRFTGPIDKNNDGLSDGFKVYLVLRDRMNDVVKAAGAFELELWDLAAGEAGRMLGKWRFGPDVLQKHYLSGLLTEHYLFEVPFAEGKYPQHSSLTLKLRFTEVLTGRSWDAQSVINASVHRPER